MEEQTNIAYLAIAFSVIVVVIVIGFILFVILQKIKRHKLEAAKEILETQNNDAIERIQKENKEIKDDFLILKKEIQELKKNKVDKVN